MQLALLAIAFTASKRRLPSATKPLRVLISALLQAEVLASAETTDLEKASSISLSFVVKRYFLVWLTRHY
jgi:hypothetical protein